jgi:hypothetical protein
VGEIDVRALELQKHPKTISIFEHTENKFT